MRRFLEYQDDRLFIESVSTESIAKRFGTPCYAYSKESLEHAYRAYDNILGESHLIAFAVKANGNPILLKILKELGAGFDVVSGGELQLALSTGVDPKKVVFSGVAKSRDEIALAIESDIGCFNVESKPELERIDTIARELGKRARISIRVNPNVDPKTHPYISTGQKHNKFGIAFDEVESVYVRAREMSGVVITGISFHIGSQLSSAEPILEAFESCMQLVGTIESHGITLKHVDIGGGLGVVYGPEDVAPDPATCLPDILDKLQSRQNPLRLIVEPGRSIVAHAGTLITTVEYLKEVGDRQFVIVDAAFNDFARPALYGAYHEIWPTFRRDGAPRLSDVVGPICESSDFLALDRHLNVEPGDTLCLLDTGAYGYSMSSNYNMRPRPAEVLIAGNSDQLIRSRESLKFLINE